MPPDPPLTLPPPSEPVIAFARPPFGLRQLAGAARRHWWIPVVAILLGVGSAVVLLPRPDTARNLGVVVGLVVLCAVCGLLLRERVDPTIRRFAEMEHVLRVPGLTIIPPLPPGFAGRDDDDEAAGEAFKMLRERLRESNSSAGPRCVMVTGSLVDQGATTTAAHLARAYAQRGQRVLLIDCEMSWPRLHTRFGLPAAPGLSELLADRANLQDAFRTTAMRNLYLLPAGISPPEPAVLLTGDRFGALLASLSMLFDVVILDAPPVLTANESLVLAAMSDGVVLVVRAGHTHRDAAQEAMRMLGVARAPVIGAVLNDAHGIAARYDSPPTAPPQSGAHQAAPPGSASRESASWKSKSRRSAA